MAVTRRGVLAVGLAACLGCTGDDDDAAGGGQPRGGFGNEIDAGAVDEVVDGIRQSGGALYLPEGRAYLVRFPPDALDAARAAYDESTLAGMEAGFVALYQKCTHLGCRVPHCESSKRFECPCHASVFNRVGEWVAGPAPRGLDRFPVRVADGRVLIDTGTILEGAAQDVATVDGEPAGPVCIQAAGA